MPITKSAKKALRQSVSRHTRNLKRKEAYKNITRDVRKLVESGKLKEAQEKLPSLYQTLDKIAKTGLIKKNKASRLKSRIAKSLNKKSE